MAKTWNALSAYSYNLKSYATRFPFRLHDAEANAVEAVGAVEVAASRSAEDETIALAQTSLGSDGTS